jgi:hypothetical protein
VSWSKKTKSSLFDDELGFWGVAGQTLPPHAPRKGARQLQMLAHRSQKMIHSSRPLKKKRCTAGKQTGTSSK